MHWNLNLGDKYAKEHISTCEKYTGWHDTTNYHDSKK